MEKGGAYREQPPLKTNRSSRSKGDEMIICFLVDFKKLIELGRKYPWPKPKQCLRCKGCRLWGHGFVLACFDGYNQTLEIKRCRCPDCDCIFRFRPEGYFKRFQADIETIRSSIASKVQTGKWKTGISGARQLHWFRALGRKIKAHLTDVWDQGVLAAFDYLADRGIVPVSRSI